jgi:hypothetical protein
MTFILIVLAGMVLAGIFFAQEAREDRKRPGQMPAHWLGDEDEA